MRVDAPILGHLISGLKGLMNVANECLIKWKISWFADPFKSNKYPQHGVGSQ